MKNCYIGIDIGGTHISCAVVDVVKGLICYNKLYEIPVDSGGNATSIISSWQTVIQKVLNEQSEIQGIGLAVPGPFDYSRGISLIEGVSKYDALFGINLKTELRKVFPDYNKPVSFINDASGFALGEYFAGCAHGSRNSLVVTLGTGFGSTFLRNGKVIQTEGMDVPPNGYLYNIPYKKSIADDYFSTRWFVRRWEELTMEKVADVKSIVESGNDAVVKLFDEFTDNLYEFLLPWLSAFQPDVLVIGGSIAKASHLFLPELSEKSQGVCIKISELGDKAPIIGAAIYAASVKDIALQAKERKTEQFLAPEKGEPASSGKYDIYPAFPVGSGKIKKGLKELSEWIVSQKTVIIDGYEGIFWDALIEQIAIELSKTGKQVRWHHIEAALLPAEVIETMIRPYMGEENSIFGKITNKKLTNWFEPEKLKKLQPDPDADINILIGCGAALAGWDAPLIYVDLPKNELQFRMRAGSVFNLGADKSYDGRIMYKRAFFVDWPVLNEHKKDLLPRIDWIIDGQRPDNYLCISGNDFRKALSMMSKNFIRVRPWFEPGAWGGNWMKKYIDGINKNVSNLAWSFELMVLENGIMFESDNYRLEVSFDFLMYENYREILGDCADRFQYDFPIRFDFLDTFDGGNLSIQCHPRTEYIRKEFGMSFTQDETYYILDCQNNPVVYLGFQEGINPEEFHKALLESSEKVQEIEITRFVQSHHAKKHNLFLIPNGTIHASGKDNLVLEISSAPYIFTFKMYDWLRLDLDGRPRPINIEHGMKNLYFERQGEKVKDELICKPYVLEKDEDYLLEHLPTHPVQFYDVHRYSFRKKIRIETKNKCHVWMLVEGSSVIVETAAGMKQRFNYAETFVIPAATDYYTIRNEGKRMAIMVKAFVK